MFKQKKLSGRKLDLIKHLVKKIKPVYDFLNIPATEFYTITNLYWHVHVLAKEQSIKTKPNQTKHIERHCQPSPEPPKRHYTKLEVRSSMSSTIHNFIDIEGQTFWSRPLQNRHILWLLWRSTQFGLACSLGRLGHSRP
jgi:hypothetical protein